MPREHALGAAGLGGCHCRDQQSADDVITAPIKHLYKLDVPEGLAQVLSWPAAAATRESRPIRRQDLFALADRAGVQFRL